MFNDSIMNRFGEGIARCLWYIAIFIAILKVDNKQIVPNSGYFEAIPT